MLLFGAMNKFSLGFRVAFFNSQQLDSQTLATIIKFIGIAIVGNAQRSNTFQLDPSQSFLEKEILIQIEIQLYIYSPSELYTRFGFNRTRLQLVEI